MPTPSRPEFVIFYAWQSDRPGNGNRYLIQEAAVKAAETINADPASPYEVRIDQDTQGVPGLCDIPATILEKIDKADGFLCDLTYVATSAAENEDEEDFQPRYCSNPNVLFELGYAFRSMGFARLLCVMNERYGPVAEQIFDIAHRRYPFTYTYPAEDRTRTQVLTGLAAKIEEGIRALFPLGMRSESGAADRVQTIRTEFETRVRVTGFHGLVRRQGGSGHCRDTGSGAAIRLATAEETANPAAGLKRLEPRVPRQGDPFSYAWRAGAIQHCRIADRRRDPRLQYLPHRPRIQP